MVIPLVLLLGFSASCQKQEKAALEEAIPAVDIEAEKAAVQSIFDKYAAAWRAADIEAILSVHLSSRMRSPFSSTSCIKL